MATQENVTVTMDELIEATGLNPGLLDQKCSDDHMRSVSQFLDWRRIAPHIGLTETDQHDIELDGKDESEKRLKTLQFWKSRFGFKATYRKLIQAYLTIDNADHAERVIHTLAPTKGVPPKADTPQLAPSTNTEARKFSPTCSLPIDGQSSQDSQSHSASLMESDSHDASLKESDLHHATSLSACSRETWSQEERVKQVEREIARLEGRFCNLTTDTSTKLNEKECESPNFLPKFRTAIASLPASLKYQHIHFLKENRQAICKATTVGEIFFILSLYMNFLNYGLLQHIINTFGDDDLKRDMKAYLEDLTNFCFSTKMSDFVYAWTGTVDITPEFSRIVMTLGEEWTNRTLQDILVFRRRLARASSLEEYVIQLMYGGTGSIILTMAVPSHTLPLVIDALSDDFVRTHHIKVTTDEVSLVECRQQIPGMKRVHQSHQRRTQPQPQIELMETPNSRYTAEASRTILEGLEKLECDSPLVFKKAKNHPLQKTCAIDIDESQRKCVVRRVRMGSILQKAHSELAPNKVLCEKDLHFLPEISHPKAVSSPKTPIERNTSPPPSISLGVEKLHGATAIHPRSPSPASAKPIDAMVDKCLPEDFNRTELSTISDHISPDILRQLDVCLNKNTKHYEDMMHRFQQIPCTDKAFKILDAWFDSVAPGPENRKTLVQTLFALNKKRLAHAIALGKYESLQ